MRVAVIQTHRFQYRPILRARQVVVVSHGVVGRRHRNSQIFNVRDGSDNHSSSFPGLGATGVSGATDDDSSSGLVTTGALGIWPRSAGSSSLAWRLPSVSAAA